MTRKQRATFARKVAERQAYVMFNESFLLRPRYRVRRLRDVLLEDAVWIEQRILEGKPL